MWIIILILAVFQCKPDENPPSRTLDKILSKHYTLTYSDETRRFLPFDSVGKLVTQRGIINRNENYMVSKSDSDIGILEDSTCFYMDNRLRIISVGPKSVSGAFLIQPLCDPYEIVNYAISNKMGFQEYVEDGKMTYNFIYFKKDELIYNIVISFYNDYTDSFSIKFIYNQYPFLKQDIISYKFVTPPSGSFNDKIADFLDFKDGKYQRKEPYKQYLFGNAFLMLRMLKKK
jgi:hypothetical protein